MSTWKPVRDLARKLVDDPGVTDEQFMEALSHLDWKIAMEEIRRKGHEAAGEHGDRDDTVPVDSQEERK